MATGKANWPLGMTVRSTHHAIGSGLFREPRFGVFAGMSRSGLVRVILDGETTPRAYHPRFWRKAPSLHPAQPSQDVAGTSSESLAGLSKEKEYMLTTISKTFDFDAAHRLDRLPADHKCHRLHGHTYRVEIRVRGEPGGRLGMVIDYADLAAAWEPIHKALDHRCLNEIAGLEVPTTEVLAAWIYDRLRAHTVQIDHDEKHGVEWKSLDGLSLAVRVYESSTTYAEVGRA